MVMSGTRAKTRSGSDRCPLWESRSMSAWVTIDDLHFPLVREGAFYFVSVAGPLLRFTALPSFHRFLSPAIGPAMVAVRKSAFGGGEWRTSWHWMQGARKKTMAGGIESVESLPRHILLL